MVLQREVAPTEVHGVDVLGLQIAIGELAIGGELQQ